MPPKTPLSQLVLWVPPALAAAWEGLEPDRQTALTQDLVRWLTSRMLPASPRPDLRTLVDLQSMTVEELTAFVQDLERKYRRRAEGGLP